MSGRLSLGADHDTAPPSRPLIWWRVEAWEGSSRRPRPVSFAVEARGPLAAMRRVHDLGYRLRLEEEPTALLSVGGFEADYRLPLREPSGGVVSSDSVGRSE